MAKLNRCLVLFALFILFTSPTWGQIAVTNPSFELPACPAGCPRYNGEGPWTIGDPTGWIGAGGARGVFQPHPGLIFNAGFPTDGSQLGYTNPNTSLTQNALTTIAAGVTYTLTVDVGRRYAGLNFRVVLLANSAEVAVATQTDFPAGLPAVRDFGTIELSYAGTAATAGQSLGIKLHGIGDQTSWDNVRLSSSILDTDGDGVPDDEDICSGGDDTVDTDNDNVPDACDPCPFDALNDSDGDGSCDSADLCLGDDATGDTDGDGLCDNSDPCAGASNNDVDGDGVCDEGDLCFGDDATGNTDGDGVCNDLDACDGDDATGDTDADGMCDDIDACPLDAENDADGDGVCGDEDNCPEQMNTNQSNNDGDALGDVCDPDDDNDTVLDGDDNCPLNANPDQFDFDGDGAGDICDLDDDGDGVFDATDACPATGPGEVVAGEGVDQGCSIADLCPCENNWKNHGAYVRCVARASGAFVDVGLITEAEKDVIVSEAGQSECGHKN